MTPRQAAVLAAPGVVVLALATPVGLLARPEYLTAAAVAVGLTVPAAFGTFWLTHWLAARHPLGIVIGMFVGTILRMGVAFGGGAAIFLLTPAFRSVVLGYWLWLLFAYLLVLLVETALLTRQAFPAAGGLPGEKG